MASIVYDLEELRERIERLEKLVAAIDARTQVSTIIGSGELVDGACTIAIVEATRPE
jgi:tetrahydromethanopterin S-methyltransferase subunit B